jgi:hypothetical protein
MGKAKQNRNRSKRSKRRQTKTESFASRLSTVTAYSDKDAKGNGIKPFAVGMLDGKIVYTSKNTRGLDYVGKRKRMWLQRMALRLMKEEGKP